MICISDCDASSDVKNCYRMGMCDFGALSWGTPSLLTVEGVLIGALGSLRPFVPSLGLRSRLYAQSAGSLKEQLRRSKQVEVNAGS